jgi:hypothetical protein
VIGKNQLLFLNQALYEEVGKTAVTDYRPFWKGNLEMVAHIENEHTFSLILQAKK